MAKKSLRSVQWEEMTSPEFASAVKATGGVCILTVGAMERHGEHLPLGNDSLAVHEVAIRAAKQESAVVFPPNYFGLTLETRNQPGSVALRIEVLMSILDNVCDEIGRNGLKKIIILNGHGGNENFLPTFLATQLERPRGYQLYLARLSAWYSPPDDDTTWKAMKTTTVDWHAGETETAMDLGLFPDRVRKDKLNKPGMPTKRLAHLPPMSTAYWWTAMFPGPLAGDPSAATEEQARYIVDYEVRKVAEFIRAVKQDRETEKVAAEFFEAVDPHRVLYGPRKKTRPLR
ncbi:MAG: creatininase family protein [Phycisphaeraceae bacterium]|nr:creatininase family protein [Phycisphaeraceae bacterium]